MAKGKKNLLPPRPKTEADLWRQWSQACARGGIDWLRYPKNAPGEYVGRWPDRLAVIAAFSAHITTQAAANIPEAERQGSWRERWFTLGMACADALQPYRGFLQLMRADVSVIPLIWRGVAAQWPMISHVLYSERYATAIRPKVADISLWLGCPVFFMQLLRDDSNDLQPTMAWLDRWLQKIESANNYLHSK